jgi:hypothetical protein
MKSETKALLEKAEQSLQAASNLKRDGFLEALLHAKEFLKAAEVLLQS